VVTGTNKGYMTRSRAIFRIAEMLNGFPKRSVSPVVITFVLKHFFSVLFFEARIHGEDAKNIWCMYGERLFRNIVDGIVGGFRATCVDNQGNRPMMTSCMFEE